MAISPTSPALTIRTPGALFQQVLSTVSNLFADLNPAKHLRHDPVAELLALADAYETNQPGFAADLRAAAVAYEGRDNGPSHTH